MKTTVGPSQAECGSLELHAALSHKWQGSKYLGHFLLCLEQGWEKGHVDIHNIIYRPYKMINFNISLLDLVKYLN